MANTPEQPFDPRDIPYGTYFLGLVIVGAIAALTFIAPLRHSVFATFGINQTLTSSSSLEDGLVGHWTFDGPDVDWSDTLNEIKDVSSSGINLGAYGTMNAAVSPAIGVIGQGMWFDGVDNRLYSANDYSYNDISFAGWVNTRSVDNTSNWVIGKRLNNNDQWAVIVMPDYSLRILDDIDNQGAIGTQCRSTALQPDTWYHFVAMMDSLNNRLFINGEEVACSDTATDDFTSFVGTLRVSIDDTDEFYHGFMDDLRIYNRALSADEVQRLYRLGEGTKIATTPSIPELEDSLVGHWTFDGPDVDWGDTSSEIKDRSGNGNHGNATTSMSYDSTNLGIVGQAMSFDGVGDSVALSSSDICNPQNTPFTFSVWFKTASSGEQTIFRTQGANDWTTLYLSSGGDVHAYDRSSATAFVDLDNSTGGEYADGEWHHAAFVRIDVNTGALYVDGVSVDEDTAGTGNANTDANTPCTIGIRPDNLYPFEGELDDVRFYNRALSAEEVQRLYRLGEGTKIATTIKSPGSPLEQGLVGHWTFDGPDVRWQDSSSEIKDVSGNGNHGDAQGGMNVDSPTFGKLGQAMEFDGVDDVVAVSDDPFDFYDTDDITLVAWVKGATNVATEQGVITKMSTFGGVPGYGLVLDRSGDNEFRVRCVFQDGSDGYNIYSDYIPFTDFSSDWHMLVCAWDQDNASSTALYINGEDSSVTRIGDISAVGDLAATRTLGIGRRVDSVAYQYGGAIDDVRIYNRALSAAEVQQLYQLGR